MLGSSKIDNVLKLEDEHTDIEILNFQIRYVKTYFEFHYKREVYSQSICIKRSKGIEKRGIMEKEKITSQSKHIYDLLPKEMRDNTKKVSMEYRGYLRIIQSHLKTIYGMRADWNQCIKNYQKKNKELNGNFCNDIPELSMNEIKNMVEKEEINLKALEEKVAYLNEYLNKKDTYSDEEYVYQTIKCAQIIGVAPEVTGEEIFLYMIDRTNISKEEMQEFNEKFINNLNIISIIILIVSRLFTPGIALEFPCVGTVITQKRSHFYYRGENALYGSSKPSLFRNRSQNITLDEKLIDLIRRDECWNFLDKFDVVKHWSIGSPNYLALAQHYGFRTEMIDITNDLKTALFFGCCKYINGKWKPLEKKDIEERYSRKGIVDSRYGVLYITRTEIMDMQYLLSNEDWDNIVPIGYQPFMRCSKQHGFMLLPHNAESCDMYQDNKFKKYKYRLTPELCKWIYSEMDNGEKIYPYDDVPNLEKYLSMISNTTQFTESVVMNIAKELKIGLLPIRKKLRMIKPGYSIRTRVDYVSPKKLNHINQVFTIEKVLSKMDVEPAYSPYIII